jgi:hypothetical protein
VHARATREKPIVKASAHISGDVQRLRFRFERVSARPVCWAALSDPHWLQAGAVRILKLPADRNAALEQLRQNAFPAVLFPFALTAVSPRGWSLIPWSTCLLGGIFYLFLRVLPALFVIARTSIGDPTQRR